LDSLEHSRSGGAWFRALVALGCRGERRVANHAWTGTRTPPLTLALLEAAVRRLLDLPDTTARA
jgi:hypothetical protein